MSRARRGRFVSGLVALGVVALVAVVLFLARDRLRAWWTLRTKFDALGRNAEGYEEHRHRESGVVFVMIPGGTATLGTGDAEYREFLAKFVKLHSLAPENESPEDYIERHFEEVLEEVGVVVATPRREVTLPRFLISKREVSRAEWRRFYPSTPDPEDQANYAAVCLDLEQARGFWARQGFAVPSEDEWEYACTRWKPHEVTLVPPTSVDSSGLVDSSWRSGPVDTPPANPFGLYGVFGNVEEWVIAADGTAKLRGGSLQNIPPLLDPRYRREPAGLGIPLWESIGLRPVFRLYSD